MNKETIVLNEGQNVDASAAARPIVYLRLFGRLFSTTRPFIR